MSIWDDTEIIPNKIPIIQLGINDWELGKNFSTELAILGNVKSSLEIINQEFKKSKNRNFLKKSKPRIEKFKKNNWLSNRKELFKNTQKLNSTKPIRPEWLMLEISESLPKNYIVIEEGLVSTRTLLNYLPIKKHNDFYGLASGGIGWAISGAIGASLANPDKTIIAVIGDGSSMYGIQSLWTAAHYNLNIIYIIANNNGYRIIKERLEAFHKNKNFIGMDFKNPPIDFVKLSIAMGIPATRLEDPKNISNVIKNTIKNRGPHLLDILVDNGYN